MVASKKGTLWDTEHNLSISTIPFLFVYSPAQCSWELLLPEPEAKRKGPQPAEIRTLPLLQRNKTKRIYLRFLARVLFGFVCFF